MAFITDTFSGALSSSWYRVPTGATPLFSTASDQLKVDAYDTAIAMRWVGSSYSGDQYAQIKITALPGSNWGHGPIVKLIDGSNNGYVASFNSTRAFVQKSISGSIVVDATSITLSVNDLLRLTAESAGANLLIKLWKSSNGGTSWSQLGSTYTDTSPFSGTLIGIGTYAGDSAARVDDFEGGDYVAGGGGTTITVTGTTSLPAFSGSAQVSPVTSITVTTALPAFSGGASMASASATVTATTLLPSYSGGATGDTSSGTLTLPVLKNNTGTVLANETGATVHVYAVSTGNKVVTKTGQTTNGSGVMTVTDALIVGGTQYRVVVVLGSGAEGLDKVTAS